MSPAADEWLAGGIPRALRCERHRCLVPAPRCRNGHASDPV